MLLGLILERIVLLSKLLKGLGSHGRAKIESRVVVEIDARLRVCYVNDVYKTRMSKHARLADARPCEIVDLAQ